MFGDWGPLHISLLILSATFGAVSAYYYRQKKDRQVYLFLFLSGLSLFSFAALLTPFLNPWDERFHALVAKNLISHPLMPTLYDDPVVTMAYDQWDRSHIWLHKQPLFLWQIAVSFTLFGFSEFVLRIPSIILASILLIIVYRTGSLLITRRAGLLSSLLVLSSLYLTRLVSGGIPLDHNDVSFIVYVSLSIWALIEYYFSRRRHWIVWIGLFSGFAILCKWLPGLLVYLGFTLLWFLHYRWNVRLYKPLLLSLLVTLVVVLPWQIFILVHYPVEALHEYAYNSLHFMDAVENHGGPWYFHIANFSTLYGPYTLILFVPALYAFYMLIRDRRVFIAFAAMIAFTYCFFSLAATKMPTFVLIAILPVYLSFGALWEYILQRIERFPIRRFWTLLLMGGIGIIIILTRYDISFVRHSYSLTTPDALGRLENKRIFTSLSLPPNAVLFNVPARYYIDAMFYMDIPSYNFVPSEAQVMDLKKLGRIIAIVSTHPPDLPAYLLDDPSIIIVPVELYNL